MKGQASRSTAAARPRASRRSSRRSLPPTSAESFAVVGLGASAGGLDAFRRLLAVLPAGTGMAFILIQHLDPTHHSMMVDLLADHTPMTVKQAANGMSLEPEHVYMIPPGAYLSIRGGALRLSQPRERHGVRLPFDFFLRSLAEELGERAICVILSGTGSDGSSGAEGGQGKGRARRRTGARRGRLRWHAEERHHDRRRGPRVAGSQDSRSSPSSSSE